MCEMSAKLRLTNYDVTDSLLLLFELTQSDRSGITFELTLKAFLSSSQYPHKLLYANNERIRASSVSYLVSQHT